MNKLEAIAASKQFRKDADELLQRMKAHKLALLKHGQSPTDFEDQGEVIAQHIISTRDLEACIMRQGLVLKHIGTPDPYPTSKDPSSPGVEPTADGLTM